MLLLQISSRNAADDGCSLLVTLSMSSAAELIQNFQMNREEIDEVCDLVEDKTRPSGCRSVDLLLKQKVLVSLLILWQ